MIGSNVHEITNVTDFHAIVTSCLIHSMFRVTAKLLPLLLLPLNGLIIASSPAPIVFFTLPECRRFWESNLGLERFGSQIWDWRDLGGEFEAPNHVLNNVI